MEPVIERACQLISIMTISESYSCTKSKRVGGAFLVVREQRRLVLLLPVLPAACGRIDAPS